MARKGDSKSKAKTNTGPTSKAKNNNTIADLTKGKEAPSVKAGVETTSPSKAQKKR